MNTDEREARSLGRWLDQPPGTTPPDGVDSEAVEAVYALRPDLAPRARVSADDILALVTKGPLAASGAAQTPVGAERGGEVVPFPARRPEGSVSDAEGSTPLPAPVRRRGRFLLFAGAVGGTGGIGLALVAAATLMLVAVPALQRQAGPSGGELMEASPAATSAPASSAPSLPAPMPVAADEPAAADPAERRAAEARPARAVASTPSSPAAKEMADGRIRAIEQTAIPEVEEQRLEASRGEVAMEELDAVADAEPAPEQAAAELAPAEPMAAPAAGVSDGLVGGEGYGGSKAADEAPDDAGSVRARAMPTDRDGSSWRADVDADTLARIDQAIEKANGLRQRGDRRGAGDQLAGAVQAPARAGQHVAALAAQDYLAAGDPRAAAGVAQRGLGLGSANTPERSWLLVLYGDALDRQGKQPAAIDAYEQASDLNVDR